MSTLNFARGVAESAVRRDPSCGVDICGTLQLIAVQFVLYTQVVSLNGIYHAPRCGRQELCQMMESKLLKGG